MENYQIIEGYNNVPIKAWVNGVEFEDEARNQVVKLSSVPGVIGISVMSDVHAGKGSTVGTVIATRNIVLPATVSVDLGCGVLAIKTSLTAKDLPTNLREMRELIERKVPCGRTNNGGSGDRGAWSNVPSAVLSSWHKMREHYEKIVKKHPKMVRSNINDNRAVTQLCSLGTGNHFIEVCLDLNQSVWVMLHSGSRGIGNSIGSYFIDIAKNEMVKNRINLMDPDLAFLTKGTDFFADYCDAVEWAQNYAQVNRELMMDRVLEAIAQTKGIPPFKNRVEMVHCHHNYISYENILGEELMITRKGALRADKGMLNIICGSMGTKSFIVRGLGNTDSFNTNSHGAGRRMSRTQAKKTFTLEDHALATQGVECRKDLDVLDESPGAYKEISHVMNAQKDLCEIVYELKQILNVKG